MEVVLVWAASFILMFKAAQASRYSVLGVYALAGAAILAGVLWLVWPKFSNTQIPSGEIYVGLSLMLLPIIYLGIVIVGRCISLGIFKESERGRFIVGCVSVLLPPLALWLVA